MMLCWVLLRLREWIACCFFFKQKTAYEMRISDWSSDVCSSDLIRVPPPPEPIMSRLLIPAFVAIALACSACGPSAPPSDPTPSATEPTAQTSDPSPSAATAPGPPVPSACTQPSPASLAWGRDQDRVHSAPGRTALRPHPPPP